MRLRCDWRWIGAVLVASFLAVSPARPQTLAHRLAQLEAAIESGRTPPRPPPEEMRAVEAKAQAARRSVTEALRRVPGLPADIRQILVDTVDHVADIRVTEWHEIYREAGEGAHLAEILLMVMARMQWMKHLGLALQHGTLRGMEDLPYPDPRITRLLLRIYAEGGADEVAPERLDTVSILDTLGAFEPILGVPFRASFGDRLKQWLDADGDPGDPPRSTDRQLARRAREVLERWPQEETIPRTLGEALDLREEHLEPLPVGTEPSLLRVARYQRELHRTLAAEAEVRRLHDPTLQRLEVHEHLPLEFRGEVRSHLEELRELLQDSHIEDAHETHRHPYAPEGLRGELEAQLALWRQWRHQVARWAEGASPSLEGFPLPEEPVVERVLENLRGSRENPEHGHDHVFARADTLEQLDRIGFFLAAAGEPLLAGDLGRRWEHLRDGDLGDAETERRLEALELQLAARLNELRAARTWRYLEDLQAAIQHRGGTLGEPRDAPLSLLEIASRARSGAPPPTPPDLEPPPTEVPAPPWQRPEASPLPPPPPPPDTGPGRPDPGRPRPAPKPPGLPLGLIGLAMLCATLVTCAWLWRRGKADEVAAVQARSQPPTPASSPTPSTADTQVAGGVQGGAVSEPPAPKAPGPPDPATRDTVVSGAPAPAPVAAPASAATAVTGAGDEPVVSPGGPGGTALPSWLRAALDGALGDRYRDRTVLGAGGMGTVVKAFDTRLERPVAVKVPPPHLASQEHFQIRFLREARAVARLDHPNIGRVIDVPEVPEGELPVMILEFLDGTDLGTYLDRQGPPAGKVALGWVRQAGLGLQHAHEQGILHRDIKPANLMLVRDRVKILDFGLAALEDRKGLTRSGMLMGSIPYMPPEQLRGEPVGVPADVYALGVTTYQLLTGKLPFDAEDAQRTVVPRVSQAGSGTPAVLDDLLLRALDPDPAARYASVQEFLDALAALARARRSG